MVKLALTERRRLECDAYIFPEEYYDIPGVEEFSDLEVVKSYVRKKLEPYAAQSAAIYLNGGLSIELLSCLQIAAELDMNIVVLHYDKNTNQYVPQEVTWKPVEAENCKEADYLTLCAGRHPKVTEEYIFAEVTEDQVLDFTWQAQQAEQVLSRCKDKHVVIYLTGLTSLYISVLNAAARLGIAITFLHYNYDTEEYFPQEMTVRV